MEQLKIIRFFLYNLYRTGIMKKGIAIAIGIAVVIVIAIAVAGMTTNTGTETRISNSTNTTSIQTLPAVAPGKNLSVTLSENVGVGAH